LYLDEFEDRHPGFGSRARRQTPTADRDRDRHYGDHLNTDVADHGAEQDKQRDDGPRGVLLEPPSAIVTQPAASTS
jgi:hypothetical protein